MSKTKIEMYHANSTYLEGWYSIAELKRIVETAERINETNKKLGEEATQHKPMGETLTVPGIDWLTIPKG
jgi:hypothetical protein